MELDSVYEEVLDSYINDYTIFEATLRRDYYEVSGILNEEGKQNFLITIWKAIRHAFSIAREKIVEVFNKIFRRNNIDDWDDDDWDDDDWEEEFEDDDTSSTQSTPSKKKKVSVKQLAHEYESLLVKNIDALKDFSISGFRVKPVSVERNTDAAKLQNSLDKFYTVLTKVPADIALCNSVKEISAEKFRKDTSKSLKECYFQESEIKNPFNNGKDARTVIGEMINCVKSNKFYSNEQNEVKKILKLFEKCEQQADNYLKGLEQGSMAQKIKEVESKAYLDAIQVSRTVLIGYYSTAIKIKKEVKKQYIKLLKASGEFIKRTANNESVDMDYIDSLAEATAYELMD